MSMYSYDPPDDDPEGLSEEPRLTLDVSLFEEPEWDLLIAAVESGEVGADTTVEQ